MEKSIESKKIVNYEVFHCFHHYLEASIPDEEWLSMSVEEVLQLGKDVAALAEGTMSPTEFGRKHRLPRK